MYLWGNDARYVGVWIVFYFQMPLGQTHGLIITFTLAGLRIIHYAFEVLRPNLSLMVS